MKIERLRECLLEAGVGGLGGNFLWGLSSLLSYGEGGIGLAFLLPQQPPPDWGLEGLLPQQPPPPGLLLHAQEPTPRLGGASNRLIVTNDKKYTLEFSCNV